MIEIKKDKWEESYERGENFIYYPKEEVVKFLNRFVKKRKSTDEFVNLLNLNEPLKALDFGCGIGRTTILLREFCIDSYGIDISQNAIDEAIKLGKHFGYDLKQSVTVYDGNKIPFSDNFFDFTISEGVMDSMTFELAKNLILEVDRVTKKYFFLSLISSDSITFINNLEVNREFVDEIEVNSEHENGTIQSFFNIEKIEELIKNTNFKIKWCEKHIIQNIITNNNHGRYYLVLEKTNNLC
ncbi:SAM-dependent methyltransferase [Aliarcobacter cibarius]|uniref:SAM-dependent methyltransferase n=1 Tax=Aliarcobacter cibarius TaxID=255507 RepID=A0A7L5JMF4_9BACT|nr:class I SAM-dependent methyltransferase [Aliarcobacter cibarius]QKJ26300.1 SAM-dependent methyltransferase [Aliarcobacter cibarius]